MTDHPSLAQGADLGKRLVAHGHTVAIAESSTGGLVAATLLAVPGASAYFRGGSIIYTARSRYQLLQTDREELRQLAGDREQLTLHFARRIRTLLHATWGIAELGIAGPTGSPYGDPPGLSVVAVDGPISRVRTIETGSADREANMWRFAEGALALLSETLASIPAEGAP